MKYYVIAGEASGDLHGSNLIKELRKLDISADFRCWGGDKMKEQGATLVRHYRELAFMGFAEVIMNLRTIFRNLRFCKEDILEYKPDTLILIDYPGFNLRIAKWAKEQGLRVIYYISPQVWAWKEGRVRSMKQCIDKMIVILPFEKDYYKNKWDWEVEYLGHPLAGVIKEFKNQDHKKQEPNNEEEKIQRNSQKNAKPVIALLPGSRKQEIIKKLPVMLEASQSFPQYHFIVAKAPGVEESFYDAMLSSYQNVSYVADRTYELLMQSKAALVTSGTATLETALFEVPEVVCYKGSWLSYQIGKRLVNVKYISLVNLIMDKLVVKELIQNDLTPENLRKELGSLLNNEERKKELAADYKKLQELLNAGGNASAKAAASIYQFLRQ